jgi:hypothetical protein
VGLPHRPVGGTGVLLLAGVAAVFAARCCSRPGAAVRLEGA